MPRPGQRLAIIGASVRAAAYSAVRAGYEVVAADLFADADLAQLAPALAISDYPNDFASWLRDQAIDGWLYTGGLENYPELIAEMAEIAPLLGNTGAPLRQCRDPLWLQSTMDEAGVRFPRTQRAQETEFDAINLPTLAKTYRGSSGHGVWLVDDRKRFDRACHQQAYLQEIVGDESLSAVYLIDDQQTQLVGITRQQLQAEAWQYVGSTGPADALRKSHPTLNASLQKLGKVLWQMGLRGIVGVDLMIDNAHCWLIEVNPRYPASAEILEACLGVSLVEQHVKACQGEPVCLPGRQASDKTAAKQIVFAKRAVSVGDSLAQKMLAKALAGVKDWPPATGVYYADVPRAGTLIDAGHPVATLLSFGPGAEAELKNAVRQFQAELEHQS